jgi:hypothetical protein
MRTLPDPIGGFVRRELERFGRPGDLGEIVDAWPAAVGRAIANNAWPARLARDGTLHVTVASSAWAFELTQLAAHVLARLRSVLGEGAPPALRFVVGPLPERGREPETSSKRIVPKPTRAQQAKGEQIAAPIQDSTLREAVAKAAAASLAAAERASADRPV